MNNNDVLCKFVQVDYHDECARKIEVNVQVILQCIFFFFC
jgi:hypothetical protein